MVAFSLFTDGYEEVIRNLVNGLRFARGAPEPAGMRAAPAHQDRNR